MTSCSTVVGGSLQTPCHASCLIFGRAAVLHVRHRCSSPYREVLKGRALYCGCSQYARCQFSASWLAFLYIPAFESVVCFSILHLLLLDPLSSVEVADFESFDLEGGRSQVPSAHTVMHAPMSKRRSRALPERLLFSITRKAPTKLPLTMDSCSHG